MIVSLLALPDPAPVTGRVEEQGLVVRRATMGEMTALRQFILAHFTLTWADGTMAALSHMPAGVFVATDRDQIVGFAAHSGNRPDIPAAWPHSGTPTRL